MSGKSEDLFYFYERLNDDSSLTNYDIDYFSGNIESIDDLKIYLTSNINSYYILINLSNIKNLGDKLPDILKVLSMHKNQFIFLISDLSKVNTEEIKSLINSGIRIKNIYYQYYSQAKYIKCSPEDFYNMIYIIEQMVKLIEQKKLSPYEKLIYAYDITKAYEYKIYEKQDDWTISRVPHEVLKNSNEYIVCAAFAAILNILLIKNNIYSEVLISEVNLNKKPTDKHAFNIFRLIDTKYNINGIYTADATQDSITFIRGQNAINNYARFCITPFNTQYIENEQNCLALKLLYTNECLSTQIINDSINSLDGLVKLKYVKNKYISLDERLGYNNTDNYIEKQYDCPNEKDMKEYISLLKEYSNKKIPIESLIKAVINVRKAEGIDVSECMLKKSISNMLKYSSRCTKKTLFDAMINNSRTLLDIIYRVDYKERLALKETYSYYNGVKSRKIKKLISSQR